MPETLPKLTVSQREGVCVVTFDDRKILDQILINEIGKRLSELTEAGPEPRLLLDFQNVEHLSSAALGVLITLNKQVLERQGRLVLAGIQPQIYEVFKITRLNKLFTILNTTEDGIKTLS